MSQAETPNLTIPWIPWNPKHESMCPKFEALQYPTFKLFGFLELRSNLKVRIPLTTRMARAAW